MKHLKRFNENITSDNKSERFQSMMDLVKAFHNVKITPPEDVPINKVYKGIVIKTVNKVDTTGLGHGAITTDTELSGVEVYTDIPEDVRDRRNIYRASRTSENKNFQTNWIYIGQNHHYSVLPGHFNLCFYESEGGVKQRVSANFNVDFHDHLILDYNDVNHAELENLLSEFGIEVDEMWGIPR
jgi:hypothetical protein